MRDMKPNAKHIAKELANYDSQQKGHPYLTNILDVIPYYTLKMYMDYATHLLTIYDINKKAP